MVKQKTKSKHTFHIRWFSIIAALLTVIGLVSLAAFMLVHWTERQILTTDNWVAIVSNVPKDEQVANALSDYTVTSVSNSIDLEGKISQALPDKAAFLAPPLTDQLESRLKARTKTVIQSDDFATVWQNANRLASQKILERARSDTPPSRAPARFNIDLPALKSRVESLLTASGRSFDETAKPGRKDQDVNIGVDLKASLQRLKTYIRAVDFLNGTLGLLAVVSLLGAIVASRNRRRLIIVIGISVFAVCLIQLISAKAIRPAVLNQIANSSYKPAVGVVYDTLLTSFKEAASATAFVGALVALAAFITSPRRLAQNKTLARYISRLKKTAVWKWGAHAREIVGHYLLYIMAMAALFWLLTLAFAIDVDWQGVIRAILFYILFFEVCKLVALKPGEAPMKQAKK